MGLPMGLEPCWMVYLKGGGENGDSKNVKWPRLCGYLDAVMRRSELDIEELIPDLGLSWFGVKVTEWMVTSWSEIMNRVEEISVENKMMSLVFDQVMWELPMEYICTEYTHGI